MIIKTFSGSQSREVRELVLEVLKEEGFEYDPLKDSDLDDIEGYYHQNGGIFYTAIAEGKLIGTSAARKINDTTCEIKRIYLRKDFRGRGFGRELFSKALEYAGDNYPIAVLKTDAGLKDAIDLYRKNGFLLVKEEGGVIYFEKKLSPSH